MLIGLITLLSLAAACLAGLCTGFESLAVLWILPVTFAGSFLLLLVLAFLFLLAVIAPLSPKASYDKDSPFYRTLVNWYIELIITLVGLRFDVAGMEKRPADGRFLLVSNHLHEIDPGVLMHFFPKSQLAFVAKKEVAGMFLVGKLLPRLLCQFLDRENDREALKSIVRCIQLLKADEVSVGVFPEGGINDLRKFKRLKPGVFKIAQKAKVPIVVCTLQNTHHVIGNLLKGKRTTVRVRLLEVIEPAWMEGKTTVEIADFVHSIMAADLGPENCYPEENA